MLNTLNEIYKYREMLKNLVRKDLRTRYKGSILGFLWTFLNPLLQLVVYTIVFSTIMRAGIQNYSMFMFVGLLPWIFFSTSVLGSTGSIVSNKDLIKKVYFPREIIPISVVTSALMNMLFGFIILFIALIITDVGLSWTLLYLPFIVLVQYILALAFSMLFAALNVYFRDLEHILGILMMAWFYLTPVLYSVDMIPESYINFYYLNPMTFVIMAYRDVLFYKQLPDILLLIKILLISIVFFLLGLYVFRSLQKGFAEEI